MEKFQIGPYNIRLMNFIASGVIRCVKRARKISQSIAGRSLILFLFLLSNTIACTPVPPKVIEISKGQTFRPSTPDEVKDVNQATAAVITAAANLGLPTIHSFDLRLYPSTESFAYWGRGETDVSKIEGIPAYTRGLTIHLDLGRLHGRPWGSLVGLLAHEYGHVVHNSLRGAGSRAGFEKASLSG